jgi:homopolymeric O-antigen transport system ATP-binding protein
MSRPIIEDENLSKRYRLGQFNAQTMREEVGQFFARLWNIGAGRGRNFRDESSEFWALKGVSFSVQPSEVVGIIGRNGAGKSTLLKILCRITEPTTGQACIRGRIGSLLEVGTGFHPELTGRENIYLNGAILGMTRAEIRAQFDEIVAFAEVDKFLDTPIKRYSSGMYVRLGFAVAAHLEPEILVVDEALAVGDHEFQQKCLGKMKDVSQAGRTVLFVSHNIKSVEALCTRVVMLEEGSLVCDDQPSKTIQRYLRRNKGSHRTTFTARRNLPSIYWRSRGRIGTSPREHCDADRIRVTVHPTKCFPDNSPMAVCSAGSCVLISQCTWWLSRTTNE